MDQLYRSLAPRGALRPYVRRILVADETAPIDVALKPAPTGYNYLGWVFSGSVSAETKGTVQPFAENCLHVAGQIQFQDISVRYQGLFGHIIAEFEVTGFYELIPMSPVEIYGRAYPLVPGFHDWADTFDLTSPCRNTNQRVERFQDFLCDLVPFARKKPNSVSRAARLIEDKRGLISIADVAQSLAISERSLCRHFQKVAGVAPKYFGRIVQFNHAMTAFTTKDQAYLTELAHELGYYDQAHFNKSIRQFLHTSPQKFLDGDNDVMFEFLGRP
ncbi:helix-turn-helix domain-containing protein [Yoonia maritima]|uniref:helix-turn-helix domain-containing protein n=1 Tax=Yoonia maritima TaxID=1435347 RepID=UPI000D103796|nr:helix-turn-helix domain-containing protein [Yoonia maritima]